MYESIDQFMESLEGLKSKFNEQGPIFTGKGEILAEICQGLIVRAADYLTISSRKVTDTNLKKIQDKA